MTADNPLARAGLVAALLATAACVPSNQLLPLRGEDPVSLEVSKDKRDWLDRTGATRAVEAFRNALMEREWTAALERLGPATRAAVDRRAKEAGREAADLLGAGGVPGLGLPGADDPLVALAAPGKVRVTEESGFDPGRRRTRVKVRFDGGADPIEVPALFTEDGWRVELVRVLDVPPAAPVPASGGPG
jgi:hypothetical protein